MIDRTLDLDANEYVVNNTAECDWILAESREQRVVTDDQRTEHWVILGFDRMTERLREYVELPPSIPENQIVDLLGNPPDPRCQCWDASSALLGVVEEATGRRFDVSKLLYMIEYERDSENG